MEPIRTREELEALYDRHVNMVYQICLMLLKNVPDAEDATQTVFRKVMEYQKPFRDPEHEKAWLIVCAQNHCRDVLKSAHRTRQTALPEDIADERRARQDETLDAVLALPEKYRLVIHLFYYEDYSVREIADILRITPDNVKTRLSRGRASLRSTLKEAWEDDESGEV